MQQLWPTAPGADLTDADLEALYAYPDGLRKPFVQVNFVSAADGAATVDGRSEGLSHPDDKKIFALGRDLADVVLVGAGTVRAEGYRGVKATERRIRRRRRLGLDDVPPIAVVSNRAAIEPDAPILTDTTVPPMIFTAASAPIVKVQALLDAGADVIVAGDEAVSLPKVARELHERELYRVDCEGGPHLFGGLLAADLVDQLCLTLAPLLAGPGPERIVSGPAIAVPQRLQLDSALHADGFLFLRYRRT